MEEFQDELDNAKELVANAQELDENAEIDTESLNEFEKGIAPKSAELAIGKIGSPKKLSLQNLDDDEEKVQNAVDKVEVAENYEVKDEIATPSLNHLEWAQDIIENLNSDKVQKAKNALQTDVSAISDKNNKKQVKDARDLLDEATELDGVTEDDFTDLWKLEEAEDELNLNE